ncbi:MAG: hypothetical protein JW919_06270 [Candidatus Omnitrophica bacterium]|nr:hypothetical protein [Candidatus Omnitrophota bacterium]
MQKIRYELDPYNRLVATLPKYRKVLDGRFRTAGANELTYHVKSPVSAEERIPHQLKLKGAWSLTDSHDLRLTLDKQGRRTFGDKVTLQGEMLDAREDSLLFAVTTTTKAGTLSTYVLELEGRWKADKRNRLTFRVKKEAGGYDILTFNGAWEIDKDHRIIYQYEKASLIRKKKRTHTLAFKGHWDIKDRYRISYVLSGGTDAAFDFEAKAGVFRKDYIEYEVGIALAGRAAPLRRTVKLTGKWNIRKGIGLVFETGYEGGRTAAIVFGADATFTDRDTVSFRLRKEAGQRDLGASVELSRKLLKGDGEAFLRILKSRQEASAMAGAGFRW